MQQNEGTFSNKQSWRFSDFYFLGILIPISFPLLNKFWNVLKRKDENLNSKVVVITGANSGLGEALAHVFYKAGCKVVLAGRREEDLYRVHSDLLAMQLESTTHSPVVMKLDLEDLNSIPIAMGKILQIHNRVDILINNAGISIRSDVLSTSIDVDMKVMLTNYFGAVALTKAVLPTMIKEGDGRIVFISSVQGKFALPYRSAYCASKHAIQAFSDSLRAEVSKNNIKVTCISPGYIKTSLSKNALTANGDKYGKMDSTTSTGINPDTMAKNIYMTVLNDEKDVIFAQTSAKIAYWLRFICPSLYFWIMNKRANKM